MDQNEIEKIAIIGMAGRFPGAVNITEFWKNLANGVESISTFSDDELLAAGEDPDRIQHPDYVKTGTILAGSKQFDAPFFGFSPKEAVTTNPQHRIFLETCWQALEDSGYSPDNYPGAIAVFGGSSNNGYAEQLYRKSSDPSSVTDRFQVMMGNDPDFLATRVAYKLNLTGPALTIQTACSTSLVAVHQACQNLLTYQCDMALSGGACVHLNQGRGYLYQEGIIFSPDGHCRAFDADAQGTVFGQGVGVVVLKRLSEALADGDTIQAVITGSAINNDGSQKVGFTAPSVDGQAEAISIAQAVGEVEAESIGYIETHGTGTPLGDPIEVEALTKAFRETTDKKSFCAIGSVKTNIGHLDIAAGIAGLIKTVLALQHKQIPPSLHFSSPNPNIDFADSPFYVNSKLKKWESHGRLRRAGVSSFGIGGTNAHVVLEETPPIKSSEHSRPRQLLLLSAKTDTALDTMATNLADHLTQATGQNLADVAYTLQVGRKPFKHRRIAVCETSQDASKVLKKVPPARISTSVLEPVARDVVFMFSGQGAQYINMGLGLYESEPLFREQIDYCANLLEPDLGLNLRDVLYPDPEKSKEAKDLIHQTRITQPALFIIEYALARLWMHWGISPAAMVGHSIGEYVAACLSGVFSLDDALHLVATRGRLMQSLPAGSMLAVSLSIEDIQPYLPAELSVAVVNGASNCVVSGETNVVEHFEKKLSEQEIDCQLLRTSHAFHSPMMDPILDEFIAEVEKVPRNSPQIPFVSNVSGTWITETEVKDPGYWAGHLRRTVNFFSCARTLLETSHRILLEVGPGQTLNMLTRLHPAKDKGHIFLASTRHPIERKDDMQVILHTLGQLWLAGMQIEWQHFYEHEKRLHVPLPSYPFERKRHWFTEKSETSSIDTSVEGDNKPSIGRPHDPIDKPKATTHPDKSVSSAADDKPSSEIEILMAGIWSDLLVDVEKITQNDNFFDLGGDSLQAALMFSELEKKTGINLPLGTLFKAPTLGRLSEVFRNHIPAVTQAPGATDSDTADPWSSLVAIQANGTRPPFFCVHAVGSNVLNYRIFTKYLEPDQPLYGLQAKGLDGISEPFHDLKAMATHYISEIRTVQPHGPYLLGGGSLGGMIAYEMAQQLLKTGERIDLLVLFDTQGPKSLDTPFQSSLYASPSLLKNIMVYYHKLSELPAKEKAHRLRKSLMHYLQEQSRNLTRVSFRLLKKPMPHNLRYQYLEKVNLIAWAGYTTRYYKGKMTLFRAYDKNNLERYDPKHGWQGMADELKVIEIPGEHASFVEEALVGEELSKCLQTARKKP